MTWKLVGKRSLTLLNPLLKKLDTSELVPSRMLAWTTARPKRKRRMWRDAMAEGTAVGQGRGHGARVPTKTAGDPALWQKKGWGLSLLRDPLGRYPRHGQGIRQTMPGRGMPSKSGGLVEYCIAKNRFRFGRCALKIRGQAFCFRHNLYDPHIPVSETRALLYKVARSSASACFRL